MFVLDEKIFDISEFEKDLRTIPINCVANRYLFDSFPYCFKDNPDIYYFMREEICKSFNIHPKNFCIVGSGKIGFSLNPENYGKEFDNYSDIDIVLISDELFHQLWLKLIYFKKNSMYKLSSSYKKRFNELQNSLFYGVIRLDKLSDDFDFAKEWWTFFNRLSKDEKFEMRRIRGAIFKSWQHVSTYYEYTLTLIKNIIEVKNEGNGI